MLKGFYWLGSGTTQKTYKSSFWVGEELQNFETEDKLLMLKPGVFCFVLCFVGGEEWARSSKFKLRKSTIQFFKRPVTQKG